MLSAQARNPQLEACGAARAHIGALGDPNREPAAGNFLPRGLPRTEPALAPAPCVWGRQSPVGLSLDPKSLFQMAAWAGPGEALPWKNGVSQPLCLAFSCPPPRLFSRWTLLDEARAGARQVDEAWERGVCPRQGAVSSREPESRREQPLFP